jgi:cytochrome c-type biogenesis protein CcmE
MGCISGTKKPPRQKQRFAHIITSLLFISNFLLMNLYEIKKEYIDILSNPDYVDMET